MKTPPVPIGPAAHHCPETLSNQAVKKLRPIPPNHFTVTGQVNRLPSPTLTKPTHMTLHAPLGKLQL